MFRSSLVAGCFIALMLPPTAAQQPTQAQRDALRAACRSDFMANCAGVQPGGKEAFECLLRNDAKLSSPCRSAVNAIATPASSPAVPAAAAPPQPSESSASAHGQSTTPPATQPSVKTSHPATAPAQNLGATRTTTTPAAPNAAAAASGSASGPTAPAVAPLGPIRPMLPRRALMILAQCRPEQQRLCAGVPAGGGKILSCLAANAQQLSPTCYEALARVSE